MSTSALELSIDIVDPDRVIQVNSPVAGFLQRFGRSGRREGAVPNCLILALNEDTMLLSAGLLLAWSRGHVEPVSAPPCRPGTRKPTVHGARTLLSTALMRTSRRLASSC